MQNVIPMLPTTIVTLAWEKSSCVEMGTNIQDRHSSSIVLFISEPYLGLTHPIYFLPLFREDEYRDLRFRTLVEVWSSSWSSAGLCTTGPGVKYSQNVWFSEENVFQKPYTLHRNLTLPFKENTSALHCVYLWVWLSTPAMKMLPAQ